jgi:ferredoxin
MTSKHKCIEGRALGVDLDHGYPCAIIFCTTCRTAIKRVPMDDLDESRLEEAVRLIKVMKGMRGK